MKATVVRDGKEQEIEARELVAGDICVLEEGQMSRLPFIAYPEAESGILF